MGLSMECVDKSYLSNDLINMIDAFIFGETSTFTSLSGAIILCS